MGHRNMSNKLPMFEIDQEQNRNIASEQPYIYTGRTVAPDTGPPIHPTENMLSNQVHSTSQWDSGWRPNDHSSSNFGMEVAHSRASYNPFPYMPSTGGVHSNYYNGHSFDTIEGGLPQGPFKRKSPTPGISVACERGSTSRFYDAGSSSSSYEFQPEKRSSDYHIYPSGPIPLPNYIGGSPSIASEDSLRNVRSRSRLNLEPNPRSHHYRPTNLINHTVEPAATREQNRLPVPPVACERFLTPETSGLCHVMNRFSVGGSASETGGFHHRDSGPSRNPVSSSQYLHRHHHPQAVREGRTNYFRRDVSTYRAEPSYPRSGHENGLQLFSESNFLRFSRPSSSGGWRNNYRNGRSRTGFERFQSFPNAVDMNDRMEAEGFLMVDRSSLYDSRNMFDQYRDLRLDIDDMGYEELLALEDRIGNVSTGLSEYMISKCVMEITDSSSEEAMCAICLEGYKEKNFAKVKNCGHDYHVHCIKKWLSMKNACPICKAPAVADGLKEE